MAGTVVHRHQRRIAAQRGWYPDDGGAGQVLAAPEADLHLPQEMQADPIGWARRHAEGLSPVRTFDETELVNTTVCARANYFSGARRILAIALWAVAAVPALVFLGNLCPETMPQRAD